MVLAEGVDGDVLDNYHAAGLLLQFAIFEGEEGCAGCMGELHVVPRGQKFEGLRGAQRRIHKARAGRVLAQSAQQRSEDGGELCIGGPPLLLLLCVI